MKSKKKYNKRIFSGVLSAVMLTNFCTVMPISVFAKDDEIQEITSDNGHRYQLFDTSMNWHEAEAYCESLGGHLVTINSDEEQQFINNNILSIGTKNTYYIGMYRIIPIVTGNGSPTKISIMLTGMPVNRMIQMRIMFICTGA